MLYNVEYRHWIQYERNGHIIKTFDTHNCIIESDSFAHVVQDLEKHYTEGWIEPMSILEFKLYNGEKFDYSLQFGGPTG